MICVMNVSVWDIFILGFIVDYVDFTFKVFWGTDSFYSLQNLQTHAMYCKHPNKLLPTWFFQNPKSYILKTEVCNYNKCRWACTYLWLSVFCLCPKLSIFDLFFCKMNSRAAEQVMHRLTEEYMSHSTSLCMSGGEKK